MRGKVSYAAVRFSLCPYLQRFSGLRFGIWLIGVFGYSCGFRAGSGVTVSFMCIAGWQKSDTLQPQTCFFRMGV
jgi:hypothetical protein